MVPFGARSKPDASTGGIDYGAAQRGLTNTGISLAELRQRQSDDGQPEPIHRRATPPPAPPAPPLPEDAADEEDAYKAFCSEIAEMESGIAAEGGAESEMTWEGLEEILRSMMGGETAGPADAAPEAVDKRAENCSSPSHGVAASSAANASGVSASPPMLRPVAKVSIRPAAKAAVRPEAKVSATPPLLQPVKEEMQDATPLTPRVVRPPRKEHRPQRSHSPSAANDDYWLGVPDFVDVVEARMVTPKKEVSTPSRLVPSGHKLVKLRPAPMYEATPVATSATSRSATVVKQETPAQQEITTRRESRRRQAFLRDARCKAICKIKRGLRQQSTQEDRPYIPEEWSTEFEPLLGDYFDFIRSRPDQFLLVPVSGNDTVVNVAGTATVKAAAWGSWRKDWKVKSERVETEGARYNEDNPDLDKTEQEKWAEAEPLPGRKRPATTVTGGTPWSKLQKTEATSPRDAPLKPHVAAPKEDGDWSRANSWRRYKPLNMEVLAQPLPPMRPVRDTSGSAAADDASTAAATAEESTNDTAEADEPDEQCDESGDEDCFVVDVIGGAPSLEGLLPVKEEEPNEDSSNVESLLKSA